MLQDEWMKETAVNREYALLSAHGLKSAALYYLHRNQTPMERAAAVLEAVFRSKKVFPVENGLPDDADEPAWVEGDEGREKGLYVDECGQLFCDWPRLYETVASRYGEDTIERAILEDIRMDAAVPVKIAPARYFHAGAHAVFDVEYLIRNGYEGYRRRIREQKRGADAVKRSFLRGMERTLDALLDYFDRCAQFYAGEAARTGDEGLQKLALALARVPRRPCGSFFEGILVYKLLMLLIGSEPTRPDKVLIGLYEHDLRSGELTREQAAEYLNELCRYCDKHANVWHMVIGGCDEDGKNVYNDLTRIVLENIGRYAHPHVTLRVNRSMPEEFWRLAVEKIGSGAANPSLVNEEAYLRDLTEHYHIPLRDARNFVFGGCSELIIMGKTHVDATWVAFNTLDVLNDCVYRHLVQCSSYEEFYAVLMDDYDRTFREMMDHINVRQHVPGTFLHDPLRSLHTDGCLESGKGYWNGGAVYNFDSAGLYGTTDVVNSLTALKALFAGELGVTAAEFLRSMKENFSTSPLLRAKLKKLPKFGNGNRDVQETAQKLIAGWFDRLDGQRCWRGNGHFLPSIIAWITYASLGKKTGASPDGRPEGHPLADSSGACAGTDENGPTALFEDCLCLPQERCAGTLVLNLKLDPQGFRTASGVRKAESLFRGYFASGGTQLQVNVLDEKELLAAYENPQEHRNLIVRVGGFSDYYCNQSPEIRKVILDRISHRI